MVVSSVRPEVRALKAYHLDLTPTRYKLDQNEVPVAAADCLLLGVGLVHG